MLNIKTNVIGGKSKICHHSFPPGGDLLIAKVTKCLIIKKFLPIHRILSVCQYARLVIFFTLHYFLNKTIKANITLSEHPVAEEFVPPPHYKFWPGL